MLFTVPSSGGFKRKPYSPLVFKILTKVQKTRKLESIHELHFVEWKNEGRKPDKISSLRRLEFMPINLDKKCCSRIPSQVRKAVFFCRRAPTAVLL
jgi:hypothetical protein